MKKLTIILCSIITILCFGCKAHKKDVRELVDQFAALECRAVTLRKSRFELANQIRFTQDTLLQFASTGSKAKIKAQLAVYNDEKEAILKQSLSLADTIHNQLNYLMKNELTNEHDKQAFTQLLDNKLQEQGCTN